jgi:hypothetical protein
MLLHEPSFDPDAPRHPHQEIADLLAVAFLRIRLQSSSAVRESAVDLGFAGQQRVHANPSLPKGVR